MRGKTFRLLNLREHLQGDDVAITMRRPSRQQLLFLVLFVGGALALMGPFWEKSAPSLLVAIHAGVLAAFYCSARPLFWIAEAMRRRAFNVAEIVVASAAYLSIALVPVSVLALTLTFRIYGLLFFEKGDNEWLMLPSALGFLAALQLAYVVLIPMTLIQVARHSRAVPEGLQRIALWKRLVIGSCCAIITVAIGHLLGWLIVLRLWL